MLNDTSDIYIEYKHVYINKGSLLELPFDTTVVNLVLIFIVFVTYVVLKLKYQQGNPNKILYNAI